MRRDGYLQIGDVAKQVDLSLRTVRFYEEQGIITPVGRSEGGFRLYTDEHVARLMVVRRMKPLGFSVAEMQQLLTAMDDARNAPTPAHVAHLEQWALDLRTRCTKLEEAVAAGHSLADDLTTMASTLTSDDEPGA